MLSVNSYPAAYVASCGRAQRHHPDAWDGLRRSAADQAFEPGYVHPRILAWTTTSRIAAAVYSESPRRNQLLLTCYRPALDDCNRPGPGPIWFEGAAAGT